MEANGSSAHEHTCEAARKDNHKGPEDIYETLCDIQGDSVGKAVHLALGSMKHALERQE